VAVSVQSHLKVAIDGLAIDELTNGHDALKVLFASSSVEP
jgi:hypothetical protein